MEALNDCPPASVGQEDRSGINLKPCCEAGQEREQLRPQMERPAEPGRQLERHVVESIAVVNVELEPCCVSWIAKPSWHDPLCTSKGQRVRLEVHTKVTAAQHTVWSASWISGYCFS